MKIVLIQNKFYQQLFELHNFFNLEKYLLKNLIFNIILLLHVGILRLLQQKMYKSISNKEMVLHVLH